jgi:hypothetical protein
MCSFADVVFYFRLGYLVTTFLFGIFWVEESTLKRIARAIETGKLTGRSQAEEGEAEEVLIMLD